MPDIDVNVTQSDPIDIDVRLAGDIAVNVSVDPSVAVDVDIARPVNVDVSVPAPINVDVVTAPPIDVNVELGSDVYVNADVMAVGPTGDTGPANELMIGTVQKGEDANATITGTPPHQTLNLTLPKGDQGDVGPVGPQGSVAGSDTQVQYNDNGSFAADSGFTYDKTTNDLSVTGDISAHNFSGSSSGTNTGDQDLSSYAKTADVPTDNSQLTNGAGYTDGTGYVTTDTTQTISGDKTFTGTVDMSGATVVLPNISFKADPTGVTGFTTNKYTEVPYTEVYDYGNNFSNSVFTAPLKGIYHFDFSFMTGNVQHLYAGFGVNLVGLNDVSIRTDYLEGGATTANYIANGSADINLNVGDTVCVKLYIYDAGDVKGGAAWGTFDGHLVVLL